MDNGRRVPPGAAGEVDFSTVATRGRAKTWAKPRDGGFVLRPPSPTVPYRDISRRFVPFRDTFIVRVRVCVDEPDADRA